MSRDNFTQRKARVRAKVMGTDKRPRLSVYRSNKNLFAQIIDDVKGETLVSVSSKEIKGTETKTQIASKVGELIAKKALEIKIKKIVFDKSGYKYHGRLKAVAESARKAGLTF